MFKKVKSKKISISLPEDLYEMLLLLRQVDTEFNLSYICKVSLENELKNRQLYKQPTSNKVKVKYTNSNEICCPNCGHEYICSSS